MKSRILTLFDWLGFSFCVAIEFSARLRSFGHSGKKAIHVTGDSWISKVYGRENQEGLKILIAFYFQI